MDGVYKSVFPIQKLPKSKKNEEWQHASVDAIIGREGGNFYNGKSRYQRMKIDYDLYNGIFDPKDMMHLTNPFNVDDSFPASPQEFNIIRPKINLLIGEETKRPFNFRVISTNSDSASKLLDKKKELLTDYVLTKLKAATSGEQEDPNDQPMGPEDIEKYLSKEYKDTAEMTAYHSLNYLRNKLNLDHEFMKGWEDALIAGEEIYYIGIVNGEPLLERINPLYFTYDKSPDVEFIEEGDWCLRRMPMAPSEIYDRFYDKLSEKQLDQLLTLVHGQGFTSNRPDQVNYSQVVYKDRLISTTDPDDSFMGQLINVWHACWKSYKRVGFVTKLNELGEETSDIVDETYKPLEGETIEWDWVIEVWEGYRIGNDIYVAIQPVEYQSISIDNPNAKKLPYTGVRHSNINSRSRSLVDIMKPLQYMYIVIWYRLELALARDKGKVINMDVTQIPKSMGIDIYKWMHYLSALGVNLINPYEEGWDIPGREGGKSAAFNQFSSEDLTMTNAIAQYIQLMDKIEDMVGELSGVTKQRQGSISSSELVGNVERSVVQSSHITEPLFWYHNQAKRRAFALLLDTAKYAWGSYNKKKLHYMLDDVTRVFLNISEDFSYSDYDIFVTDSTKEIQNIEALRTLMQPAMQNGASLLDVAEIMTLDNMTAIRNKLQEIEDKRNNQAQQAQEQDQQNKLEQIQAQQEAQKSMQELESMKLELERYKIDTDNQTKIQVAEISAEQKLQDRNANGIPDILEMRKLDIEERKTNSDIIQKQQDSDRSSRESELKTRLAEIQLETKRAEMLADMQLKQRDAQLKQIENQAKLNELAIQNELKQKDLFIKELDSKIKELDLLIKQKEVDSKSMDTDLKHIELTSKQDEVDIKRDEMLIKAQETDDKKDIEDAKIDIENKRLDLEEKSNEINLEIEKVKLQQSKQDIQKSKVDMQKSIVTTEMSIKKSKATKSNNKVNGKTNN